MKYIIFDVDDTILNSNKEVTPFTLKVLNYLRNNYHYKIVVNTARSKDFNKPYFDILKPDYSILFGGSLIIDKDENILYKEVISKDIINKISKVLFKESRTFSIYTLDELFSSDKDYKSQNAQYFDFNNDLNKDCYKIVASFIDNKIAYKIADDFNLVFVPYLDGRFGRFNLKTTSKENGNKKLMELINGNINDVICFGDDVGDLNMVLDAGVGVLLSNANNDLKSKVKYITKYDNDHDGVARFLIEYFNIKIENL